MKFTGFNSLLITGFLCSLLMLNYYCKKKQISYNKAFSFYIFIIVTGLIFGALGNALLYTADFAQNLTQGQSFIASIVGVTLLVPLVGLLVKFDWKKWADSTAICLLVLQSFGKIGCYFAGCCYGKSCSLNIFGKEISFIHPVQLYESVALFLILGILLTYSFKYQKHNGAMAYLYLVLYGIERFTAEFFRADSIYFFGYFSISQILAFVLAGIGIFAFYYHNSSTNSLRRFKTL